MLNRTNLLRTAGVVLLAGSAWFTTSTVALAQTQGPRPDSAVQQDVMSAFSQDSSLQSQSITATASKGVVTLTGSVQTEAQRQAAETDASNVTGVSGIVDHITVSNPNSSTSSAGLDAQASANQVNPDDQGQAPEQNQNQAEPQEQSQQNTVPPPPPDQNQPQQPNQQQPYPGQPYDQNQAPPPQPYGPPPPNGQPPYPQGYAPAPRIPYYRTPSAPVTIPAGTLLRVRLNEPLDTAHLQNGTIFQATNAVDVYESGILAIPRGATLTGRVVEAQNGGKDKLAGSATLELQLTNLNLAGNMFPLTTDVWSSRGPNKAGYTARNTAGGAVLGAIIGGIIGRGAGAAVGAGVGAVGGLAASSATNGPRVYLPAEALVDFHLSAPATVQPVSWQEAQRLASTVPALMQRPRPVYVAPGPYYRPYPYGYPYPY